jgi:hypothetical protein
VGEFTPTALLSMLLLFPLAAYTVWAKRPQVAALVVVLFGTTFVAEGAFIKLPLIPAIDKHNLPYLILFGIACVRWRTALARARPGRGLDGLIALGVLASFVTWRNNLDPLRYGVVEVTELPALAINDAIQYALTLMFEVALPFVLGRALFRTRRDLSELLRFLVFAGLVQVVFLLVEIRFSPQWHVWIYGYPAHPEFGQAIRWGGYRPMNFMAHGLALSLFMTVSFFAAVILAKVGEPIGRWPAKRVAIGLFVIVVLCKSTGSLVYAIVFGTLLAFASYEAQVRTVVVLAALVASYPMLRAFDLFPADAIVEQVTQIFGEERAQSLEFRFHNEAMLLGKARERLWFGWGGFGRSGVYDEVYDGRRLTVADGHWIIVLGMHGVVGMIVRFGILLLPLVALHRSLSRFSFAKDRRMVVGLAMICAVLCLDLIPNGLFATYPYFLIGALSGLLQEARRPGSSWSQAAPPPRPERTRGRRRARGVALA